MNIPKISKRLEAAASFSRRGARLADIGTDHAYLPIYLYTTGQSTGGVAADINKGPVERARLNICGYGAQNAIEVVQTDGLCGLEQYAPEDIYVLGMGGELIVNIIKDALWLREGNRRLILQPMTHPEVLRRWLCENGFTIVDECLVKEEKIYQIICAEYTGEHQRLTELELMLGALNLVRGDETVKELLLHTKNVYEKRLQGKGSAGEDTAEELEITASVQRILSRIGEDKK